MRMKLGIGHDTTGFCTQQRELRPANRDAR